MFTAPKKMKIAEAMAFVGDRGLFWLRHTDMKWEMKLGFFGLIQATAKFMLKEPQRAKIPEYHSKLVEAAVELELMLPLYWNTNTLHLFVCKAADQLLQWGAFHGQNMLHVERLHVLLKNLCRGKYA